MFGPLASLDSPKGGFCAYTHLCFCAYTHLYPFVLCAYTYLCFALILICAFARIPIYAFARIPICAFARIPIYAFALIPICALARLPICAFARIPIYAFARIPICAPIEDAKHPRHLGAIGWSVRCNCGISWLRLLILMSIHCKIRYTCNVTPNLVTAELPLSLV